MMKRFSKVKDYPYRGYFYGHPQQDYTLPLDQREVEDELIFATKCDIQEVSKAANPTLIATYSVFAPFNVDDEIPIRAGMRFQGTMGGIDISGMVTNVILSQLGGLVAYVKDYNSDEGV